MTLRTPSPAIGLVIALGSAAGCGSEEMFTPELGANERMIGTVATARIASPDRGLQEPIVVGDLDGDGVDDAVVRSSFAARGPDGETVFGGAVYVLYGGSAVTGSIDLASLPVLTHIGPYSLGIPPVAGVAAVGDVDGDGLADFAVSIAPLPGCDAPGPPWVSDSPTVGGAYLVYGSATRLTGSHAIGEVAALLNDPITCNHLHLVAGLGDLDGDGKADFAISQQAVSSSKEPVVPGDPDEVFVFYGRDQRLSGTVDLAATADAVIGTSGVVDPVGGADAFRAGDVDGDGFSDFIVRLPGNATLDARLVRGSAMRLAGAVALGDIGHTRLPIDDFCFGSSVPFAVALGDLDGDGADDFSLVDCPLGHDDQNAVVLGPVVRRIFYGRKGELPAQLVAADAAATLTPIAAESRSQLLAGDVDGDGVRDLILADESLHDGNGGVHVLKGRHGRLSGVIDLHGPTVLTYIGQPQRVPDCHGGQCVLPERVGAGVSLGDLTGDHRLDLLIDAASDSPLVLLGLTAPTGHSYVLSSSVIPNP